MSEAEPSSVDARSQIDAENATPMQKDKLSNDSFLEPEQSVVQPNVKRFKKRGRQTDDDQRRVTKISASGWIETITLMPVSECPPQCPDCPPPSFSSPEVWENSKTKTKRICERILYPLGDVDGWRVNQEHLPLQNSSPLNLPFLEREATSLTKLATI